MPSERYRRIRVSGNGFDRSRDYGVAASDEIHRTKAGYERAFAEKGISWAQATEIARGFVDAVEAWQPQLLTEIEGIAAGSGLSFDDVFAINSRTEVLWSAATEKEHPSSGMPRGECSSFALAPHPGLERGTLVGQNWDWLEVLSDTIVVLEVEREDGPHYVTVVEAGLLAKTTLSQAGIALAINTLVSSLDGKPSGVPFHFVIRAIADQASIDDTLTMLRSVTRASSGNYVLGSADGTIMNIETAPGGANNVFPSLRYPDSVVHTNHFQHPISGGVDLASTQMPDSYPRLRRVQALIADNANTITRKDIELALADHTNYPSSVCCHPDSADAPDGRWQTLAGIIMEPSTKTLHLAEGNPCVEPWATLDYGDFLQAN